MRTARFRRWEKVGDRRSWGGVVVRNSSNNANMRHKDTTFVAIIALATLTAVSLMQLNRMLMMWKIQQAKEDETEFIRRIHPAFITVTWRNRWSVQMVQFSSLLTEISGTEPAYPLIWTHQKCYKGFRGKAWSWKPGLHAQPGSLSNIKPTGSTQLFR